MTKCDILGFTITVGIPNSSVGIVTRLKGGRPMNRGSIPGRGILIFPKMSRTVLGPTQPPIQLEPGVKLTWRKDDPSPAQSAEVQNGTVSPLPQMSSWHAQQARGVQHQLQICLHPLGICKISKTNMPISPLKHVRQTTASAFCLLNRHGWKQLTFKNVRICQMF